MKERRLKKLQQLQNANFKTSGLEAKGI